MTEFRENACQNSENSHLSLGFTKWDVALVAETWCPDLLREAMATTTAAGVVAESLNNPRTAAEASTGDLQALGSLAEQIGADPYHYGEKHFERAALILHSDDGGRAWSHVAAELNRRRHLTGTQVRALVQRAGFRHV